MADHPGEFIKNNILKKYNIASIAMCKSMFRVDKDLKKSYSSNVNQMHKDFIRVINSETSVMPFSRALFLLDSASGTEEEWNLKQQEYDVENPELSLDESLPGSPISEFIRVGIMKPNNIGSRKICEDLIENDEDLQTEYSDDIQSLHNDFMSVISGKEKVTKFANVLSKVYPESGSQNDWKTRQENYDAMQAP